MAFEVATCWPLVNTNQGLRGFYHLWAVICLKLGVLFTMFFDFVFSFLFMFFYFVFSFFFSFLLGFFTIFGQSKWYNCSHALHLKKAPLHQAENIFEVAQISCEKWVSLFTDKYFLCYLKTIVSLFTDNFFVIPWKYFQPDVKGEFCQKQGKYTKAHAENIVKG